MVLLVLNSLGAGRVYPPPADGFRVFSVLRAGTSVATGGSLPFTDDPNSRTREPGGIRII